MKHLITRLLDVCWYGKEEHDSLVGLVLFAIIASICIIGFIM